MTKRLTPAHATATSPDQDFRGILKRIAQTRSSATVVFADFCRVVACCIAMQTREKEYHQAIKGYHKNDLDQLAKAMGLLISEMENRPFEDVLGQYYTQINSNATAQARGEYFTPPAVSSMMARMNLDAEKIKAQGQPVTISDPCCGSGGIILACAQTLAPHVDLMRVTLQDIAPTSCDMAYINTTLWGIPAEILLGDALAPETRHRWTNIHWHRVGEEERRKSLKLLGFIRELEDPPTPKPRPPPANTNPIKNSCVVV